MKQISNDILQLSCTINWYSSFCILHR